MSDIIKLRQLIESGYSISKIRTDHLGQTVITFTFIKECHPKDGQIYLLTTQDHAVILKANEIAKNNKKL